MITGALKNKIDKLWLEFWQGGVANPLSVIEQVTFLMFSRLLDINEIRDENVKYEQVKTLPIGLKKTNNTCAGVNTAI